MTLRSRVVTGIRAFILSPSVLSGWLPLWSFVTGFVPYGWQWPLGQQFLDETPRLPVSDSVSRGCGRGISLCRWLFGRKGGACSRRELR